MTMLKRRTFLEAALSLPAFIAAQTVSVVAQLKQAAVRRGEDREQKTRAVGVSATTYKVLTADTNGALFVMENANSAKGGPPKHLHHAQDELFYVLEGEYIVEVGTERFHLRAGDCALGPRGIPHAFAFVGNSTGRILLSFAPAGKIEAFFESRVRDGIKPGQYRSSADAAVYRQFDMEYVGPPLKIDAQM